MHALATPPLTVLVTIHGIGFQVSPADTDRGPNPSGYADALHAHLTSILGPSLSPDPGRSDPVTGQPFGPVYVQSHWPPTSNDSAAGLARLDPSKPLRTGDQPLAHVALVYPHLEEVTPKWGSFLELSAQALVRHTKYARLPTIAGWLWADFRALRTHSPAGIAGVQSPSLQLRRKAGSATTSLRRVQVVSPQARGSASSGTTSARAASAGPPDSVWDTLRALQNDFAAYVLRNDLRERVRGFVDDAINKLADRDDVDAIVINAHSQGTAVAFDVLTELADQPASKIRHLITSGSHLRKLVDLFNWGNATGDLSPPLAWTNFFDPFDPVADGLGPGEWKPGQHLGVAPALGSTLFANRLVSDVEVHNVEHTGGSGLRAHNYFDNQFEWVPQVARILRDARTAQGVTEPSVPGPPVEIDSVDISQYLETDVH